MNGATGRKTSSDSGQNGTLDRFTQRRLQRLNTEQGFREQRQGGAQVLSPPTSDSNSTSSYNPSTAAYAPDAQPQTSLHQASQPPQTAYGSTRSNPVSHIAAQVSQSQPQAVNTSSSRSPAYPHHEQPQVLHSQPQQQPQQQYSPPDSGSHFQPQDSGRPLQTQRSYSIPNDDSPQMNSNNGAKAVRTGTGAGNRQSIHNGVTQQGQQHPQFNSAAAPVNVQTQQYRNDQPQPAPPPQGDARRGTPQPAQMTGDDMTEEEVAQLIKDHKELRE